MFVLI
jgi:hypothetical protein